MLDIQNCKMKNKLKIKLGFISAMQIMRNNKNTLVTQIIIKMVNIKNTFDSNFFITEN